MSASEEASEAAQERHIVLLWTVENEHTFQHLDISMHMTTKRYLTCVAAAQAKAAWVLSFTNSFRALQ
jgi:hypothetical protein